MRLAQLLIRFPELLAGPINENCLHDMCCPNCGSRDQFGIFGSCLFNVVDNGSDADDSDHEWEDNSICTCKDCNYASTVGACTFEGLDARIEEERED